MEQHVGTGTDVMRRSRLRRWACYVLLTGLAAAGLAIGVRFAPNPHDPVCEGRRLSAWMRDHPRAYTPVVQAAGREALPYLLAELSVTDPAWVRWCEERFRRLEMGPPWEPAGVRHYHARLALQILDTNALPALLTTVFGKPLRLREGDPGYEAAFALTWMASAAAKSTVHQRIVAGMRSRRAEERRNACLAVAAGNLTGSDTALLLAERLRDTDPAVRAAAARAAMQYSRSETALLPALVDLLSDEHSVLRRLAAEALGNRGTNAAEALPALRAAWAAEPARPRGSGGLDELFPHALPPERVRHAQWEALRALAPAAVAPHMPPRM